MAGKEASWLEHAKKMVEYRKEALGFLGRVREQFTVSSSHAAAVARLWLAADQVDELVCTLLDDMNQGLLDSRGAMDTTRGAAIRPSALDEEALFYDCTWSLQWDEGKGIAVNLAIEPHSGAFEVRTWALRAKESEDLSLPMEETSLKEALVKVYVAEATLEAMLESFMGGGQEGILPGLPLEEGSGEAEGI